MTDSEILETIAAILGPYGEIPGGELQAALRHFTISELKKNDFWSRPGELLETVGIQLSGILRIYIISEKGDEKTCDFCRRGDIITAYGGENSSGVWMQAIGPVTIIAADSKVFENEVARDASWQRIIRKMTESCLESKMKREMELLTMDAKSRYEAFLQTYRDISSQIPLNQIASYLGIRPESLSRLRTEKS